MKKIIEKCLIYSVIFALNFLSGCKKKEMPQNEINTVINKYTLEIDNNYRIYKVSFSSLDWRKNFIIDYVYSPDSIQETCTYTGESGTRVTIYHINNSGLADSSQFNNDNEITTSSTSYFLYDSNNYLKMMIDKRTDDYADHTPDTTFYDYTNGNLTTWTYSGGIFGIIFPTSSAYTYNSIKNLIDIEWFNGTFIGKLNPNLIESVSDYGSPEGIRYKTYQYTLNSNGLVEERTCKSWTAGSTHPAYYYADKFEYKIR
jgi:hypothetical protein